MYYGVKCIENYEYVVIECDTPEDAFEKYSCEAVFDDIEDARAYSNWLLI